MREPAAALLSNLVLTLKEVKETKINVLSIEDKIKIVNIRNKFVIYTCFFAFMIDFVGVAWVWSTLSEFLAYPNGLKFFLGQRGSDNQDWTV